MDGYDNLIAYAAFIGRRRLRSLIEGEETGRILLFTGVRYEHAPSVGPSKKAKPRKGETPRRRRG